MIHENLCQTTQLALRINVNQSIIVYYLKKFNIVSKLDIWTPHELTQRNLVKFFEQNHNQR
ncbi:hypothetical protein WH47_07425 [Habropoda laboriosa]|uniref:Histone-lysine N-methyltransferase SETMAR n=1 Tax=Habropoda laboriosa TaxID=597456 RepID=A0A0L7QPX5_9HYME|nr:hypothetical protein WH47_07425 [Habropoda laboriosa]